MSRMMTRSVRKPPLPKTPTRLLRPRCPPQSPPPTASVIKTPLAKRSLNIDELEIPSEYQKISSEFQELAKMVGNEFGKPNIYRTSSEIKHPLPPLSSSIFERGRFYDEYSARRNERLKRKRCQTDEENDNITASDFSVGVESLPKTEVKKRMVARRAVACSTPMTKGKSENKTSLDFSVGGAKSVQKTEVKKREVAKRVAVHSTPMTENKVGTSRYMLRSMSKENKKPPLPAMKYDSSTVKSVTRRTRKTWNVQA